MENKEIKKQLAEKNTEIYTILEKIKESLYSADDSKNWGHVGETNLVLKKLKEIEEFFCGNK